MATPKETTWEIDPHTLAKHEILRRYLSAWFPILGRYHQQVTYIDGFSGPGRYKGGEPGSPIIALREALKYSKLLNNINFNFLFTDERDDRIQHLKSILADFSVPSNFLLQTTTGFFEVELKKLLDDLDARGLQIAPTFAFIDPFGFKGLPFDLVGRLLKNEKTEVFINVMADSMNRWLKHPDPQTTQHIVDLFGTSKVLDIAKGRGDRIGQMRLLYQQQLNEVAKFVRFFEMRNDHNRIIYYLFFATNNSLGHQKMKEAFWKVDSSSGFRFSDATNPDQLVLFEIDESSTLAKELHNHFLKQKVSVEQIEEFVNDHTAFLSPHMRSALKHLEQDQKIKVDGYKRDGTKRIKNTYPEDAMVEFTSHSPSFNQLSFTI